MANTYPCDFKPTEKKCICFILELYTTDLGDVVVAVLL